MNFSNFGLFLTLAFLSCGGVLGDDWATASVHYEKLYEWYDNAGTSIASIIPLNDQTATLTINLGMALDSISKYDAVAGKLEISGSLDMRWTDQTTTFLSNVNGFDFTVGTDNSILIDHDKAWSPSLVMLNAVDTVKKIGQTTNTDVTYKMRYNFVNETMSWRPRFILSAACTPDVTYYPFDRQNCHFTYTAWGYRSSEVTLAASGGWNMSSYSESGVWQVTRTTSSTYFSGGSSYAKFEITIQREPLFFTFNIFVPVLMLGILNGFVFLLPADSGERVGFCVTCFLTFIVFLQTTVDFLPEISSPMSLLSIYIIMMMIFSAVINILTILLLRIYHSPPESKVPNWIRRPVQVLTCVICNKEKREEEMDWPTVGKLLDKIFFLGFITIQSVFSVIYIIPIATN